MTKDELIRQLESLCETARTVMIGDTKRDEAGIEDDWLTDYEAIRDDVLCAAGKHIYATNWNNGEACDYCPHCGHEPNTLAKKSDGVVFFVGSSSEEPQFIRFDELCAKALDVEYLDGFDKDGNHIDGESWKQVNGVWTKHF